jgi:predicted nucleic acid-binding protein
MNANIFIDSNVLVYAYCADVPEKQRVAQELVEDCLRYGIGFISPQVLGEFFVTITKKVIRGISDEDARREMENFQGLTVVDIDRDMVMKALDIKVRYKIHYWDALIIASAQRAGCRTIMSEDLAHGQKYGNIVVSNPFMGKGAPAKNTGKG